MVLWGVFISFTGATAEKHSGEKTPNTPPNKTAKTDKQALSLVYLTTTLPTTTSRPFFDPEIKGLGSQGATLGVDDNNTTGRFTGQSFTLKTITVEDPATLEKEFKRLLTEQQSYFLMDVPVDALLTLSRLAEAEGSILMDVANG
ncbi:MAG TPA: hypothetical protein DCY52_06185, partial [Methylococcaceae bacterium]|nr:hypothetical protein [Methylococcaceae bacterium]